VLKGEVEDVVLLDLTPLSSARADGARAPAHRTQRRSRGLAPTSRSERSLSGQLKA
jgi:hypothetical protein